MKLKCSKCSNEIEVSPCCGAPLEENNDELICPKCHQVEEILVCCNQRMKLEK